MANSLKKMLRSPLQNRQHSSSLEILNLPKVCEDRLNELRLNDNRLTKVPSCVLNFKHLTILDLSGYDAIDSIHTMVFA